MQFESHEICMTVNAVTYRISVCFNGEFYHARIIDPPSPDWAISGLGRTQDEAVQGLMAKVNTIAA